MMSINSFSSFSLSLSSACLSCTCMLHVTYMLHVIITDTTYNGSIDIPILVIHAKCVLFVPLPLLCSDLCTQTADDAHSILRGCTSPLSKLHLLQVALTLTLKNLLHKGITKNRIKEISPHSDRRLYDKIK